MKTLDEVLKSYELSCGKKDCSQCPYDDECLDHFVCECYERMDDTFHYLKEYRDYRNADKTETENGNITDAENKPLTLEEMKQMIGKPVFAYDLWYGLNFWNIIKDIDDEFIYFEDLSQWPIDELFCDEPSHLFFAKERKNA